MKRNPHIILHNIVNEKRARWGRVTASGSECTINMCLAESGYVNQYSVNIYMFSKQRQNYCSDLLFIDGRRDLWWWLLCRRWIIIGWLSFYVPTLSIPELYLFAETNPLLLASYIQHHVNLMSSLEYVTWISTNARLKENK